MASGGSVASKFSQTWDGLRVAFDPDDYLWAGPVTLKLEIPEGREVFYRRGHYRRGVRKYLSQLSAARNFLPLCLALPRSLGLDHAGRESSN